VDRAIKHLKQEKLVKFDGNLVHDTTIIFAKAGHYSG
jgi:hypothetical protein